jgi:hypothetical protein
MKDPNEDSGSPDQENENSPPEDSQEPDSSLSEEELRDAEAGFEEQEGEVLPPEETKKSGAGKVFLILILVLAGSGGYLYFNNLIPVEILNLVSPKSTPPRPLALVAEVPPTPLTIEEEVVEVAENPEPVPENDFELPVDTEPVTTSAPQETTHISGGPTEPIPSARISGNGFDVTPDSEMEQVVPEATSVEEPEAAEEQEVIEAPEPNQEPMVETTLNEVPSIEPSLSERDEAVQAYLDFIESSAQKFWELLKQGFNWGWDYVQKNLG